MRYVHETFVTELGEPAVSDGMEETDDTPEQNMEFETVELQCGNGSNSNSQSSPVDSSKEAV